MIKLAVLASAIRSGQRYAVCSNRAYFACTRRGIAMIRKLKSGEYRLYSGNKNPKTGKRRNLGTFKTRAAAEKHEREIQYFKLH